jgi:hypothetical protein
MIYQTLTRSEFRDCFDRMGRGKQFSYDGLGALYDYLEELGDDYELGVISLCCEFTESTIAEALKEYDCETLDDLNDKTFVIQVDDDTVIYQNF